MTSSTRCGSRFGTLARTVLMTRAARSSGRHSTSEPLLARPMGVRSVATITASGMCGSSVTGGRTPIGRANKGSLVECRPDDLAALVIKTVLAKVPNLDPHLVEDVILGSGQHGAADVGPHNVHFADAEA